MVVGEDLTPPRKYKEYAERLCQGEQLVIINGYALGLGPRLLAILLRGDTDETDSFRHQVANFYCRWELLKTLPEQTIVKKPNFHPAVLLRVKQIAAELIRRGEPSNFVTIYKTIKAEFKDSPEIKIPCSKTIGRMLTLENLSKVVKQLSKPPLTPENKRKRLEFAQSWFVDGTFVDRNVIWSDEVMVKSHPSNHRQWVLVRGDALPSEYPTRTKIQQGGYGVMFWGCISKNRAGRLVSVPGSMDSGAYLKTINDELKAEFNAAKKNGGEWVFMQDNAPCHKAKVVRARLQRLKIPVLDWPPYSPDLNPIENVWSWMKHKLYSKGKECESVKEVEDAFHDIWDNLTPQLCGLFAGNMENRLRAVIEAEGGHTKY